MSNNKIWYKSWFDSKYYHILYKNRDIVEAESFIKKLVKELKLKRNCSLLDLACGKGRHSIYLNKLGFKVTGVDLSSQNIEYAKKFSNERLSFFEHDMRIAINQKFDAIFNLFTSFGYFEDSDDDHKVIESLKQSLNHHGIGVIDFMNSKKVIKNLVEENEICSGGIKFSIQRSYDGKFIKKRILINDLGKQLEYFEKVRAYEYLDFKKMLNSSNLYITNCYGDYNMGPFCEKTSSRLILLFKLKA
tara:strand:+ start:687 stop:1424 length:738 start_codon:yes stop_codon:yes gene_type:complete